MTDLFADSDQWDGSLDEPAEEVVEAPVAVAEPEPAEEAPEEPETVEADDPPRGPDGKFIPRNLEVDDPEVEALLGKYGGDPLKALKAAAEAQRHIGSLNNELGQLRAIADDVEALKAAQARPVAPHTQITEDLIDRDPATATQLAYEQGNEHALRLAYDAWKDVDPANAAVWVVTQQQQAREQALTAEIQALRQQITPMAQSQEDAAFANEVRVLTAQEPDAWERIRSGAEKIDPAVAQVLYTALETGTPEQKIGAFKALNELTRGPAQPATPAEVRELVREQALEAERAIAEASVVSATATKTEPAGKTAADLIGDEWAAQEKPYLDGWNF